MKRKAWVYVVIWLGIAAASIGLFLFSAYIHTISDKWISFIGSMIGGGLTVTGVVMTLDYQEKQSAEQHRLENLPLLSFKVDEKAAINDEVDETITITKDRKLSTSYFIDEGVDEYDGYFRNKRTHIIHISSNHPAFKLKIDDVAVNGKIVYWSGTFAPVAIRLDEKTDFRLQLNSEYFEIDPQGRLLANSFWLVRFSYLDIFGNQYYQDLPIEYTETKPYEIGSSQEITIRDIGSPVLKKDAINLEEAAKQYQDL